MGRGQISRSYLGEAAARLQTFLGIQGLLVPEISPDPVIQPVIVVGDVSESGMGGAYFRRCAFGITGLSASTRGWTPAAGSPGLLVDTVTVSATGSPQILLGIHAPGAVAVGAFSPTGVIYDDPAGPSPNLAPALIGTPTPGTTFLAVDIGSSPAEQLKLGFFLPPGGVVTVNVAAAINTNAWFSAREVNPR